MARYPNYPKAPFSASQNFLARDPSGSGQVVRVQGQSILDAAVQEILDRGDIVQAVDTLTEAKANDYESGIYVLTGGNTVTLDGGQAIYRVSDPGSGGIVMDNGNELVLLFVANTPANIITPFDSIADLPEVNADYRVSVTGYHPSTTVGGGEFVGNASARHDGVIYFDPDRSAEIGTAAYYVDSGVDAPCWERVYSGSIDLTWAGANGSADSSAFTAAATAAKSKNVGIYGPSLGVPYELDSAIDWTGVKGCRLEGDVDTSLVSGGVALTVGGFSNGGVFDFYFSSVTDGSSVVIGPTPANPIVRIFGLKSSRFEIGDCNYLQLYADDAVTGGGSVAYNQIYLHGVCRRVEIASSVGFSWITENNIHNGRIKEYYITNGGGYEHNHNKLYNPTFEGADVDIQFNGVWSNRIYGARFEGTTSAVGITFDSDSKYNSVEKSWSGQVTPRNEFWVGFIPISDSGSGNLVTTESGYKFNKAKVCEFNAGSGVVGNSSFVSSYYTNLLPDWTLAGIPSQNLAKAGLDFLTISANRWFFISDLIPVSYGDALSFDFDYSGSLVRPYIFVYDANQKLLTSEGGGGVYWEQPSLTFDGAIGAYKPSVDLTGGQRTGAIARTEVKFIRVAMFSGSGGSFENISATLYTQTIGRSKTEAIASTKNTQIVIEGAPDQGYMPKYTMVRDAAANAVYENNFQAETQLASPIATSGTSVTVDDASGFANGDIVGILLDDRTTHWSAISGLSGNAFTVTALPSGASTGNRLVVNRWTLLP